MTFRILLLCCLLAAKTSAEVDERQALADMEEAEVEARFFHSHELLLNVAGWSGVPRCSQSGDMFYISRSGSCYVCGCFTSSFGALSPRCAPCNRCYAPAPLPQPWDIHPLPDVYPYLPECPQVDRPLPYPVPVPLPGPRVLVPLPVAVPSPAEKVYIPGPSYPVPVPVDKPIPVPYPVDRPYPVYQEPELIPEPVPVPVPVPVPSQPVGVPVPVPVPGPTREVPVPVPGPPVPVPYPVEHYTYIRGRDRLIVVPVPYSETNVYSVSSIVYISPICRRYQPLVPFYIPGDSCNVHSCKVKYNFVYLESSTDQSCSGSSSSSSGIFPYYPDGLLPGPPSASGGVFPYYPDGLLPGSSSGAILSGSTSGGLLTGSFTNGVLPGSFTGGVLPGSRPGGVLPWGTSVLHGWKGWNSNVNSGGNPFSGDFGAVVSGGTSGFSSGGYPIVDGGAGYSGNSVFLEQGGGWSSDISASQTNAYSAFGDLSGSSYGSGYLNLPQSGGVISLLKSGDPEARKKREAKE